MSDTQLQQVEKTGVFDISNKEYHSSEGISRSGIVLFRQSPLHFWNRYLNRSAVIKKQTRDQILGAALHVLTLEPDHFWDDYYLLPATINRKTKAGKTAYLQELEQAGERILLKEKEYRSIVKWKESLEQTDIVKRLLANARYEQSIYWRDEDSGILCKCRPDIWHPNMISDLKTTADASLVSFQRDIYKYGYHIQAAMQQDGILAVTGKLIKEFVFIAVEKEEPYAAATYLLRQDAIDRGREEYKSALLKFKNCLQNNDWPGYEIQEVSLPAYALAI